MYNDHFARVIDAGHANSLAVATSASWMFVLDSSCNEEEGQAEHLPCSMHSIKYRGPHALIATGLRASLCSHLRWQGEITKARLAAVHDLQSEWKGNRASG